MARTTKAQLEARLASFAKRLAPIVRFRLVYVLESDGGSPERLRIGVHPRTHEEETKYLTPWGNPTELWWYLKVFEAGMSFELLDMRFEGV